MKTREVSTNGTQTIVRVFGLLGVALGLTFGLPSTTVAQHPTVAARRVAGQSADEVLARRMTIALSHLPLVQAIDSVSRVANVFVQYQLPLLAAYSAPVSIDVVDTPLGIVLERLLNGTKLRANPEAQGTVVIVEAPETATDSVPALVVVHGRVVDSATGRSLSGATVKIAALKATVVTQDSGRFTLRDVPVGEHVLTAKLFGYRPATKTVTVSADQHAIRVELVKAANMLSEVVTTASGAQERYKIGNDITVINADSVMKTAPIQSVTDLLENRVPGLTVQRTSGVPGAPSRLRLRGPGGIILPGSQTMSNDPIIIVDGVRKYSRGSTPYDQNLTGNANFQPPSALDQIDPNTIDKIEVFKGPSATSQWGADAANGVIVITTKRGRSGPTRMSVALAQGIEQMPGVYAKPGYYPWGRTAISSAPVQCLAQPSSAVLISPQGCVKIDSVVRFQALDASRLSPFGTGTSQSASATLSGGVPTLNYAVTGSMENDVGYFKMPTLYRDIYRDAYGADPPSWMRRPNALSSWSELLTLTVVPIPTLTATLGADLTSSDQRQSSADQTLPALSVTYIDTAALKTLLPSGLGAAQYVTRADNHATTSSSHVQADWIPNSTAQFKGVFGLSTGNRTDKTSVAYGLVKQGGDTLGSYAIGRGATSTRSSSVTGTLWPARLFTLAAGLTTDEISTESSGGSVDTLRPGVSTPTDLHNVSQSSTSITTAGWWVEPRLNMNSRFFVSPGLRFDGGNGASGSGFSNGRLVGGKGGLRGLLGNGLLALFPKFNLSWIAVDRTDQRPLGGILTLLRPRISFGVAGVQPESGQNLRLYGYDDGACGAVCEPGLVLEGIGNSKLHPERSREVEGGFDADLWNQRVSFKATLERKLRSDAILPITLPLSLGGYFYYVNAGSIQNTNQEFELAAQFVDTKVVSISAHASYSATQNRVLSVTDTLLQKLEVSSGSTSNRLVAGYPLDGRWARPIIGYSDGDGDGRLQLSDVVIGDSAVYVGATEPKYALPFGVDFAFWHGTVGVYTSFSYERGMGQYNSGSQQLIVNLLLNPNASLADQAGAVATSICCGNNTDYAFVQHVNTLRFDALSVNYNVPAAVSRRLRVPHASVSLQGRNLALWTNYRGKDPDVTNNLLSELNSDTGQLPLSRQWILRLSLEN